MFMAAPPQGPVAESCVGFSVSTLWRGGITCCTISGYSDKGTDVLDGSQVGKELQHVPVFAHSGWLMHCYTLAVYQIFRLLVSST